MKRGEPRLGLIARADNRGLGLQTWEAYRHLRPQRTLVVDPGALTPYAQHLERYPDGRVVYWNGGCLDPAAVEWLLNGIDVLFTAETPYDLEVYERARAKGVATVLQANPEFYRHDREPEIPRPAVVVVPTTWRMDSMPGVVHLPHGVDRQRLPFRHRTEAKTFLHVAGHPAMADRAGTQLLLACLRQLRHPARIIIRTQRRMARLTGRSWPRHLHVEVHEGDMENYWDLYEGADVLLAPRRYGGQSMPVNEALSLGMPVVAMDRVPEKSWGGVLPIPAWRQRRLRTQGGEVGCFTAEPRQLAAAIDRLSTQPDLVSELSLAADRHASAISWEAMVPRYRAVFKAAAAGVALPC